MFAFIGVIIHLVRPLGLKIILGACKIRFYKVRMNSKKKKLEKYEKKLL